MKKGILIIAIATIGFLSGLINLKADTFGYIWNNQMYSNYDLTGNTLPSVEAPGGDNYYGYTLNNVYGSQVNYNFYIGAFDMHTFDKIRVYYYFNNGSQIADSPHSTISISARAITTTIDNNMQFNQCTQNAISETSAFGYFECDLVDGAYYYRGIQTFVNMESTAVTNYRFGVNPVITFIKVDNTNGQDIILNNINNSINNQGQAIINKQQETNDILTENHTYSDEPKEETEGKNETADYEQKENQLMQSLDFNMTAMDNITINPNASSFIWNIADRLRQINPAIILLMTSILGMGIIKLVLNR